jgi:hypothetical protein
MGDLIQGLFSQTGAYAAVGTAGVAAAVAAFGWIGKKAFEWVVDLNDTRKREREFVVRFYNDVVLRVENCSSLLNSGNQQRIKKIISDMEKDGEKYRGYINQVNDFTVYTNMQSILHSLGEEVIYYCSKYITLDMLVSAQAARFESDAFTALAVTRKLAAIDQYYKRLAELIPVGNDALAAIEYLPGYGDLRKRLRDRAISKSTVQSDRA